MCFINFMIDWWFWVPWRLFGTTQKCKPINANLHQKYCSKRRTSRLLQGAESQYYKGWYSRLRTDHSNSAHWVGEGWGWVNVGARNSTGSSSHLVSSKHDKNRLLHGLMPFYFSPRVPVQLVFHSWRTNNVANLWWRIVCRIECEN